MISRLAIAALLVGFQAHASVVSSVTVANNDKCTTDDKVLVTTWLIKGACPSGTTGACSDVISIPVGSATSTPRCAAVTGFKRAAPYLIGWDIKSNNPAVGLHQVQRLAIKLTSLGITAGNLQVKVDTVVTTSSLPSSWDGYDFSIRMEVIETSLNTVTFNTWSQTASGAGNAASNNFTLASGLNYAFHSLSGFDISVNQSLGSSGEQQGMNLKNLAVDSTGGPLSGATGIQNKFGFLMNGNTSVISVNGTATYLGVLSTDPLIVAPGFQPTATFPNQPLSSSAYLQTIVYPSSPYTGNQSTCGLASFTFNQNDIIPNFSTSFKINALGVHAADCENALSTTGTPGLALANGSSVANQQYNGTCTSSGGSWMCLPTGFNAYIKLNGALLQ